MKTIKKGQMRPRIYLIVIVLIIFCAFVFNISSYPGLEGSIYDSITNKPIEDVHIIYIDRYYPLGQIINVGGANSRTSSIEVTKTDENGHFRLKRFFKISLPSMRRIILIYKAGYYSPTYIQTDDYSYKYSMPNGKSKLANSSYFEHLYLQDSNIAITDFSNSFARNASNILFHTENCAYLFYNYDKLSYKKYIHNFKLIYNLLERDSNIVKKQLKKFSYKNSTGKNITGDEMVKSWNDDLEDLNRRILRDKKPTDTTTKKFKTPPQHIKKQHPHHPQFQKKKNLRPASQPSSQREQTSTLSEYKQ